VAPGNAAPSRPAPSSGAEAPPADEPTTPARFKPMMRAGAGVEVYWWSAKDIGSTFPVIPYGIFELSPSVLFDLHVPLSLATNSTLSNTHTKAGVGLGNPTVGITYVSTEGRTSWHIGGRIGLPVAGLSDSEPWQGADALAAFSMALYDIHYWASKYVPIGMRLGVEHMATPKLFLRAAIEPTLFVPIDSKRAQLAGSQKTLFLYQLRLELEGRSDSGWGGGLGLQLVHVLSDGNAFGDKDNAQGAIEPFVSYDSTTTFARIGLLLAMDSPLGPGFDQDKVAALRVNIGSHF
ncbi:MAG: hypothetical protein JWO86_348, partial [Myxococcaceae bacterium]|nr:hypothetical protein [Myxococcaceae bacterium]